MNKKLSLYDTEPIFSRVRLKIKGNMAKWSVFAFCGIIFGAAMIQIGLTAILKMVFGEKLDEMLVQLYSTAIEIIAVICYCKNAEKLPLRTMGIRKTKVLRDYLIGAVAGVGMFSAAVGINCLFGKMENQDVVEGISWGIIALYVIGWLLQGFSEEILCRGFLMTAMGVRSKPWSAVIGSSLIFAALHLGNDNVTALAFVNLTLFGIFAGVLFLRTDSIWMVAALHSLWNFAQGNLYGIEVSGMQISRKILQFQATESGHWLNGGAFGIEGGLATTVLFTAGIVLMLFWKQRDPAEK